MSQIRKAIDEFNFELNQAIEFKVNHLLSSGSDESDEDQSSLDELDSNILAPFFLSFLKNAQ